MEKKELQIELTPDVAEGIYANLAVISHSSSEFVADFIRVLPGMPKAHVKSRIVLTPEHAKRLLFALEENVVKYEKQFGKINVGEGSSKPPFIIPGGEA
ncbi:MAG: DUF3467 domain-containing protein [Porphyromonadaceae bacterium]|nr:DUF3467 domain-containing protein [Porphyromonadaceae bacterium]MCD8287828.1 DUF3467 domain-containing protein [Porphyromonadaceae bacterium]